MQYSNKREKTKQLILDTFKKLYRENETSQITVKMICEGVGINRSTFYAYFNDVYDLQEYMENELMEEISGRIFARIYESGNVELQAIIEEVIGLIREYEGLAIHVITRNSPGIAQKISSIITERIKSLDIDITDEGIDEIVMAARYHIGGIATLFAGYKQSDIMNDTDEVIGRIAKLANEGPLTIVRKELMKDGNIRTEIHEDI